VAVTSEAGCGGSGPVVPPPHATSTSASDAMRPERIESLLAETFMLPPVAVVAALEGAPEPDRPGHEATMDPTDCLIGELVRYPYEVFIRGPSKARPTGWSEGLAVVPPS